MFHKPKPKHEKSWCFCLAKPLPWGKGFVKKKKKGEVCRIVLHPARGIRTSITHTHTLRTNVVCRTERRLSHAQNTHENKHTTHSTNTYSGGSIVPPMPGWVRSNDCRSLRIPPMPIVYGVPSGWYRLDHSRID